MVKKTFTPTPFDSVILSPQEAKLLQDQQRAASLQFQKEKTALKYYMVGKGYDFGLKALGFVERYHTGLRKDGKTPELHHQVRIALSVIQLKDLSNEELCVVAALLHDVREDYQIAHETIVHHFGERIGEAVERLTKKFGGVEKNKEAYINEIALDAEASIVKGLDRCDNVEQMVGVFVVEKMNDYAKEAKNVFLPMLKTASKLYPEQQAAYSAISQRLKRSISSAIQYVEAAKKYNSMESDLENRLQSLNQVTNKVHDQLHQLYDATRTNYFNELLNTITHYINRADSYKKWSPEITAALDRYGAPHDTGDLSECVRGIHWLGSKISGGDHSTRSAQLLKIYEALGLQKMEPAVRAKILADIRRALNISELEVLEFNDKAVHGPIPSD